MYLVLIDRRIRDTDSIIQSLSENTEYVFFDFMLDTIEQIQSRITKNYESVAIIQHNYDYDVFRLVLDCSNAIITNVETEDPNLDTWYEFAGFLTWLTTERGATYVDLLACDLWANMNWRYIIDTMRSRGVYIRASLDKTGEGGNFILESDNIDTIGMYFTPSILDYKYAFVVHPVSGFYFPGFANYYPYRLPDTNLATIKTNYASAISTTNVGLASQVSNVVSVFSNSSAIAILKSDKTLAVSGTANSGGAMPCGSVVQSDLVNITKVVGSTESFCALKTNGTIVSWGLPNTGYGALDINTAASDPNFINVNTVRSRLVNVVDIYANGYDAFAALTASGEVVLWGRTTQGAGISASGAIFISSGITKVFVGGSGNFAALKNDGTAVIWKDSANTLFTSSYANHNNKPIIDIAMTMWSFASPLFIRQNGTATEIAKIDGTLVYTLPAGATISRKVPCGLAYQDRVFFILSNSTVVLVFTTATVYPSATDVAVTESAFAVLTNGGVTTSGTASFGGSLTDTTYGLWSGATVSNPVRLVSSFSCIGLLKSDRTFVWWGKLGDLFSVNFPTGNYNNSASTVALYNHSTSNIASISQAASNLAFIRQNGVIMTYQNKTGTITKPANTNVYFEYVADNLLAMEIPFAPTITPSSVYQTVSTPVSYYVSNPDNMAYAGRVYRLYNGSTLVDSFYPLADTHTYVFSNVVITTNGTITLEIKDETNISYSITTFSMNVLPYSYTYSYTPIELYSSTGVFDLSYTDQYYEIFSAGTTYSLKDSQNNVLGTATVDASASSIFFQTASSGRIRYGPNTIRIYDGTTPIGSAMMLNIICFLEGTRILCFDKRSSSAKYIPIEKLRPGTLVKTRTSGFVPIKLIGHSTIQNPTTEKRLRDSLYKCSNAHYPEVTSDLFITGNHSVLVPELSEKQRDELIRDCGDIYMTEGMYRLPAWMDKRSERFREPGVFRIWHFALENHDYYMNYGVYANGLLVESTSLRFMNELSGMNLID
jgi:hypothetical protein